MIFLAIVRSIIISYLIGAIVTYLAIVCAVKQVGDGDIREAFKSIGGGIHKLEDLKDEGCSEDAITAAYWITMLFVSLRWPQFMIFSIKRKS